MFSFIYFSYYLRNSEFRLIFYKDIFRNLSEFGRSFNFVLV